MHWTIKLFGLIKVPMIFYCRPQVISIDDEKLVVKIPLTRRTRNHIKTMYFGALCIGADITGGFLAMGPIQESQRKIVLLFKDMNVRFLKRAEADVHFTCKDGIAVKELVNKAIETGSRQNFTLRIVAQTPSISDDIVAEFNLTLSLKDYSNKNE